MTPVVPAMALPLKERARVFCARLEDQDPRVRPARGGVRLNVPLPLRVMPPKVPPELG